MPDDDSPRAAGRSLNHGVVLRGLALVRTRFKDLPAGTGTHGPAIEAAPKNLEEPVSTPQVASVTEPGFFDLCLVAALDLAWRVPAAASEADWVGRSILPVGYASLPRVW